MRPARFGRSYVIFLFIGQITFIVSRKSRNLVADRLRANRANWVGFGECKFATADGPQSAAIIDFNVTVAPNARGGERSAVRHTLSRHIDALLGDVSHENLIVWVDKESKAD